MGSILMQIWLDHEVQTYVTHYQLFTLKILMV